MTQRCPRVLSQSLTVCWRYVAEFGGPVHCWSLDEAALQSLSKDLIVGSHVAARMHRADHVAVLDRYWVCQDDTKRQPKPVEM